MYVLGDLCLSPTSFQAMLGPETATFCSMIASILRDLSLLINPALADLDAAQKVTWFVQLLNRGFSFLKTSMKTMSSTTQLPAEAVKALKDMRRQLLELLILLWSHELLPRFPSFLLEALLIGLRDIIAVLDLDHLSATKKPAAPAAAPGPTADETMVTTLVVSVCVCE
jgi:hypothetical protein